MQAINWIKVWRTCAISIFVKFSWPFFTKHKFILTNSWKHYFIVRLFVFCLVFSNQVYPGWRLRDIQRWSAQIQITFRSVSALFITWKSLNSADFLWNSSDFWIIQNDNPWLIYYLFQNFSKYLNFEAHNSGFQPSLRQGVSNKNLLIHFCTGQRYNTYLNFWVYCYCSSNKTDMVQLFKNIFAFIGVKFQDYSKKFESLLSVCLIFTFSLIQE